jgi:hypothetical protein
MTRAVATVLGCLLLLTGCGSRSPEAPPLSAAAATEDTTTGNASSTSARTCSDLNGAGSLNDPLRLGEITRKTIVRDCAPLTSGKPYDVRYFSFTLGEKPGIGAVAGARFILSDRQSSATNPRLISGGVTVKDTSEGEWAGDSPYFTGRFLRIDDIGSGSYVLGFEKLTSPLGSLSSPPFDVEIDPR